jgi:hypothetical protein
MTQASSPLAQSAAAGHAAPLPDWAVVSVHVRSAASSHALVHADQLPAQSVPAVTQHAARSASEFCGSQLDSPQRAEAAPALYM